PVAEIDVVVRADEDPVRVAEALASPRGEEVAVAVEDQHRRILPLVEVDAVLRVHRHVADEPEPPARRQRAPGADDVVDEVPCPDDEPGSTITRHALLSEAQSTGGSGVTTSSRARCRAGRSRFGTAISVSRAPGAAWCRDRHRAPPR